MTGHFEPTDEHNLADAVTGASSIPGIGVIDASGKIHTSEEEKILERMEE